LKDSDPRTREQPLLAKEALDVLALRPGATSVEIKEAYRDLVKVWHPDRFGSDTRLRQKAEDRLKLITTAYRMLQSDRGTGGASESGGFTTWAGGDARSRGASWSESVAETSRARSHRSLLGVGWLYGCVGIGLGLMAGYLALKHGAQEVARPASPASVLQAQVSNQQTASTAAAMQTRGGELTGRGVSSADLPGGDVSQRAPGSSGSSNSAQFRVRSLSGAETDQLESECSRQKELKDATAYQTCVKAQLDLITNASERPDLNALSGAERESIESVCSEAKRLHGMAGYNRCLIAQMALWAAEPARPDMTTLNETDRSSIEAACRNAKFHEGPAAYDRCRAGLVELLAKSR
jgi:hypothetical protein